METHRRVNPHTVYAQLGIEVEPPMLDPDQKQALAENHVQFDITHVESGQQSEHGEFLVFTCESGQYRFRFSMADPLSGNKPADVVERVTAEYNAIKQITDVGDVVGPYTLERIEWKGGNPFYKLTAVPMPIDQLTENQAALPF